MKIAITTIDFGGQLAAPAILGSTQGKLIHAGAFDQLAAGLLRHGERAAAHGMSFVCKPLIRFLYAISHL